MLRLPKWKILLIGSAVILLSTIYLRFLYLDFSYGMDSIHQSTILKYLSIIICFITSLFISTDGHSARDKRLLQLGLFLTCMADLCLLILDYYALGVTIFCVVQTIYIYRYNSSLELVSISFIVFPVIIIYSLLLLLRINILYLSAPIYAICLITACSRALLTFKNRKYPLYTCYMISFGMLLFLLCDINVAIFNASSGTNILLLNKYNLANLSGYLMWFFYLPSQVLLSLSGYRLK
jgi:hypothetical protein